ncbi:MAG: type II secretion system protein GspD [Deltaproteobacteria bacterium CG11_big_fil_rev_8_21_14_0_20_42_23]|nr:MAG: type II secretion system protein GspD [Deltaproteobacteria bacterium CG11_big_fil_rev_8_21_14_0_20_42_23]PJC63979.1 MAG: type II secretion system protein GspD [Deltaproteobacteria bacterium CG_4_9_14_0_2_um_filter_42_21]
MKYAKLLFLFFFCSLLSVSSVVFAQQSADQERVTLPSSQDADAADVQQPSQAAAEEQKSPQDDLVYLNVQGQDIKDVIKQISKATKKNFIIDDKIRGKVTIISEQKMTREEAYQAFLSALEVAGYTVVKGPAGILKVIQQKDAKSSPIPIHVDSTPLTDSYVTRLVNLENISALEISNAIKGLISKSGNLFAYPATNTLIITDSGTNIDRLMKIIKELDQEGPQQVVEIIPVVNADAKQVASTVLNLFEAGKANNRRTVKGAADSEEQVSKIIADDRTNSIIVVASKRSIQNVRDIIARLDTKLETGDTGGVHVHYLKHAKASDIASTLSSVTAGAGAATAAKGKTTGQPAVAQFEGGIKIGADETTNALIITSSAKDYKILVDELISKLDIPRKQVYLESTIMELAVRKADDYGLKGFGSGGFGNLLGFGQTFAATAGLGGLFSSGGLVGGVLSRDNITVSVPTETGGSSDVTLPAYSAFLNLIQTYSDANIVSSPNLLTLDNEEAEINITEKIYAKKVTNTATGLSTQEPTPLESGLILKLTPQISEGDTVKMKIDQELSNFTGTADPDTGAAPSSKRKVSTTVVTQDGQTVVLGGLMQDNVTHSKSKVPFLGDIPILGLLFRTSTSSNTKSNLLILITPYVIRTPNDFSNVMRRKIEERNRFVNNNFNSKQRQTIRDTLAAHRQDLLDFVDGGIKGEDDEEKKAPPKVQQPGENIGSPNVSKISFSSTGPVSESASAPSSYYEINDASPSALSSSVPPSSGSSEPVITVPSLDKKRYSTTPNNAEAKSAPVPSVNINPGRPKVVPPSAPAEGSTPPPGDLDLAY